ncbi:uncharacterized protein LOC136771465 isoform X2 [Amia ocellicauda]|uniref:uncharacterized protein LOC136771465 isoform X2 n=1 Tax=Amia ocellicauda TaxID=2972642 RepID=UPI0034646F72
MFVLRIKKMRQNGTSVKVCGGLILVLCFSVSVSQVPVSVSVRVGDSVTLRCDGSAYRGTPIEQTYIKWETDEIPVYEFIYGNSTPGPGFENRTEIPLEKIQLGDFSLILNHTLSSDQRFYRCSHQRGSERGSSLGRVNLTVTGHEESSSVSYGQPLSLRLYSRAAVTVWFNPAGAGASLPVCAVEGGTVTPDPAYGPRVSGQEQEVTLSALTFTDQGSYTVLDSQSRTISTVNVTVTAHTANLTLLSGALLSLPLLSPGPVEVLFASAGEGASVSVCTLERDTMFSPGPGYEHRVSVQSGSLTLRSLTAADQGQYTVRDLQGDTVSTVSVSLEGQRSRALVSSQWRPDRGKHRRNSAKKM